MTASQLINFSVVSFTYTRFRKACMAQGISRESLPYRSRGQPYVAYIAAVCTGVMAFVGGYEVFLPGNWDIPTFFFSYTMIGVFPILYFGWKIIHRTEVRKPEDVDLVTGLAEVEEYTRNYVHVPSKYVSRFPVSCFHIKLLIFCVGIPLGGFSILFLASMLDSLSKFHVVYAVIIHELA